MPRWSPRQTGSPKARRWQAREDTVRLMADWWEQFPVISQRANGDRLIGHSGPFAEDLYAAGTPPAHGLDSRRPRSERVAQEIGRASCRARGAISVVEVAVE